MTRMNRRSGFFGSGNSVGSRQTNSSLLNSQMTRGQALRVVGAGAAGIVASGVGLSGAAKAATLPAGNAGTDRSRLLSGTSTSVPRGFNPSIGALSSKVTAIKFHRNIVVGTNADGSPKYVPSYWRIANGDPYDGLVDNPEAVEKTVNGVTFIEYSGEISGFINRSTSGNTEIVYGPIDESGIDHTAQVQPVNPRNGLKGINFILKIPKTGWNGALLNYHTGGMYLSNAIYNMQFDEIYLLSKGYAHVGSYANGNESATDTNHNNDEYWDNQATYNFAPTVQDWTYIAYNSMYIRDFTALMKNLCRYSTGSTPRNTYYNLRSATGDGLLAMQTGKCFDFYTCFNYDYETCTPPAEQCREYYYGNNYIPAFGNCRLCPDGSNNPNYDRNATMVFDGFLAFSPGMDSGLGLNPKVPISPAPTIFLSGETDLIDTHLGCLLHPYYCYKAKLDPVYGNQWPDTSKTFFYYSFEHMPHFPKLPLMYALAKNNSGKFVQFDAYGNPVYNYGGGGQELDLNFAKYTDALQRLGVDMDFMIYLLMYYGYTSQTVGGVAHQMLTNMHQYTSSRKAYPNTPSSWIMPPTGNIDPYLFSNNIYPKFQFWGMDTIRPNTDVVDGNADISTYVPAIPYPCEPGLYRTMLDYIGSNHVLDFNRMTWRMPEDAARLGLYQGFFGGFIEGFDRLFTQSELNRGFDPKPGPMDWNGTPLVTMSYNGRQIPQDGYGNPLDYVPAYMQAVNILVQARLYDRGIGDAVIARAVKTQYPLVVSNDMGRIMRNYPPAQLEKMLKKTLHPKH